MCRVCWELGNATDYLSYHACYAVTRCTTSCAIPNGQLYLHKAVARGVQKDRESWPLCDDVDVRADATTSVSIARTYYSKSDTVRIACTSVYSNSIYKCKMLEDIVDTEMRD